MLLPSKHVLSRASPSYELRDINPHLAKVWVWAGGVKMYAKLRMQQKVCFTRLLNEVLIDINVTVIGIYKK